MIVFIDDLRRHTVHRRGKKFFAPTYERLALFSGEKFFAPTTTGIHNLLKKI